MSNWTSYICVKDIHFHYSSKNPVLNGVNLQIEKGSIFALLGANGNGKTTLIKLLLGVLTPLAGRITIMNEEPGTPGLDIPGRRVGYMPQETALYTKLTIQQIFTYYGLVFGLNSQEIEDRISYLYENIGLPDRHKLIHTLSGGQQRSVSMALTLIHSPELVIWDEPTVGLDPIKRDQMWHFLFDLTKNQGVTVIITTHYIEEAKQANFVGFIYRGICLEQNTPQYLLDKYNCSTLEEVSYRACNDHDSGKSFIIQSCQRYPRKSRKLKLFNLQVSRSHIKALMWNLWTQLKNNLAVLPIMFFVPVFGIAVIPYVIGPPRNIPIGIYDLDNSILSRSFVDNLDSYTINIQLYNRSEIGIENVQKGYNLLFAEIPEGFMEYVRNRSRGLKLDDEYFWTPSGKTVRTDQLSAFFSTDNTSNDQAIRLYPDLTNFLPAFYSLVGVVTALQRAYQSNQMALSGNGSSISSQLFPIAFEEPIYGSYDIEHKDATALSSLVYNVAVSALFFSAFMVNNDRESGTKNRDRVTGVTKLESILSVFIFDLIVQMVTIGFAVLALLTFFEHYHWLRLFEVCILLVLINIEATLIGIMLAILFKERTSLGQIGFVFQFTLFVVSGSLWPIESYPAWLKTVSLALPFTQPIVSMQSLLIRGLSLTAPQVISGFVVTVAYIVSLSIAIIIIVIL